MMSPNSRPIRKDEPPVWMILRRPSRLCACPSSCASTPAISSDIARFLDQSVEQIDLAARQREGIREIERQHMRFQRRRRCRRQPGSCPPSSRAPLALPCARRRAAEEACAPAGRPPRRYAFRPYKEPSAPADRPPAECRTASPRRSSRPQRATRPRCSSLFRTMIGIERMAKAERRARPQPCRRSRSAPVAVPKDSSAEHCRRTIGAADIGIGPSRDGGTVLDDVEGCTRRTATSPCRFRFDVPS